jgi:nitroreductase
MFRTHKGLVFATAEMLGPLSWNRQPFRFMELKPDDQHRLQAAFLTGVYRNLQEEEWIEEFRSAIVNWNPPPKKHYSGAILAAVTLATLCLSCLYVFSAHLR